MKRFGWWLKHLVSPSPTFLTLVRKYTDANGHYIGELYLETPQLAPVMIGVSLDSLPFGEGYYRSNDNVTLDLVHDFLAYMPARTIRVGASEPKDNDAVRRRVAKVNPLDIRVQTANRFIELVLEQ